MPAPKILVLYNRPLSPENSPAWESEHIIIEIAEEIAAIVTKLGYRSSLLALGREPQVLWRELQRRKPDAVLNLYEGTLDDPESETYIAGLLNWSGIPFSGCPPQTLTMARIKHLAKMLFKSAGLPTAEFVVVNDAAAASGPFPLRFPVIVKPATQDASVGIEHASVCQTPEEAEARARLMLERFGPPALVEEFIDGREMWVGVTELPELKAHPPAEMVFGNNEPGAWRILTYSGKWNPGSADFDKSVPEYPAKISPELSARLGELAMRAFRLLGARDYARIDFRVDSANRPYILELNPNPEIASDGYIVGILQSAGIDYEQFLKMLIETTLSRRRNDLPSPAGTPGERGRG
jgi:D-alanine-D-alanine ligase